MKSRKFLFFFFFLILAFNFDFYNSSINTNITTQNTLIKLYIGKLKDTSLKVISEPIIVDSDTAFISYGFLGNGSKSNPFIIQNLEINTGIEVGIAVFNTSKCFMIIDCQIQAKDVAIFLYNNTGDYIGLEDNYCSYCTYWGIYSALCSNLTITRNTCISNEVGIGVFASNYSSIMDNSCYDNEFGIVGRYLMETNITENICEFNEIVGMNILYSLQVLVHQNICSHSRYGIDLYGIVNSTFSSNEFQYTDDGFYNYGLENVVMIDNACRYNYVGILNSHCNNISIINNNCSDGTYGIWISETDLSVIQGNFCNNNSEDGLHFHTCSSSMVVNNTCNNNLKNGIWISIPNKVFKDNLQLINNTCNNNVYGINLEHVDSHLITGNICSKNDKYGIILEESSYNYILDNTFQENKEYGAYISDGLSASNKIYGNYFICNNLEGTETGNSQCFDNSYSSRWYNSDAESGNYYSDYSGEGEYLIDGSTERTDPYPMVYEYNCSSTEKTGNSYWITLISIVSLAGIAVIGKKQLLI